MVRMLTENLIPFGVKLKNLSRLFIMDISLNLQVTEKYKISGQISEY